MFCSPCCNADPASTYSCRPMIKKNPVIFGIYLAAIGGLVAVLVATQLSANIKMIIGCSAVGAHIIIGPPFVTIYRKNAEIQKKTFEIQTLNLQLQVHQQAETQRRLDYLKSTEALEKLELFVNKLVGTPLPSSVVKKTHEEETYYLIKIGRMGEAISYLRIAIYEEFTLSVHLMDADEKTLRDFSFTKAKVLYLPDQHAELVHSYYADLKNLVNVRI
jgi:hypothetical protein